MSVEFHVCLAGSRVPTLAAWQQRLDAAGIPLRLDAPTVVDSHDGYLPATWKGVASGFEFSVASVDQATTAGFGSEAGGRDRVAVFRWQSDFDAAIAAHWAAAALALVADGIGYDPESGEHVPTSEMLTYAQAFEAEASIYR